MASPTAQAASVARASDAEYRALTAGCGVVDRSERGKLALTGADARTFLNGQVTNDVEALQPGGGCYAALLTHKGKMLADLRVLWTGDELLLDTERVALQNLFDAIRRFKVGYAVELHKRTLERGLLSLIGPHAAAVAGMPDVPEAEHGHRAAEVAGVPVVAIRTDAGLDLLCDTARTADLVAALVAAGATAVSEAAAEVVRVERGVPRYGVDLDEAVIPQEADLNARAVSFTKGCYVGQETVARLFYRGKPNRHLRGLRLSEEVAPGTPLLLGDREVGVLTTVAVSPRLGVIGLALVRREAAPGEAVQAGTARADVVELPF